MCLFCLCSQTAILYNLWRIIKFRQKMHARYLLKILPNGRDLRNNLAWNPRESLWEHAWCMVFLCSWPRCRLVDCLSPPSCSWCAWRAFNKPCAAADPCSARARRCLYFASRLVSFTLSKIIWNIQNRALHTRSKSIGIMSPRVYHVFPEYFQRRRADPINIRMRMWDIQMNFFEWQKWTLHWTWVNNSS